MQTGCAAVQDRAAALGCLTMFSMFFKHNSEMICVFRFTVSIHAALLRLLEC